MAGKQRFQVDQAALSGYSSRMVTLAQDVHEVAANHLAGNRAVGEDAFGDVGREAGMHTALSAHISDLHDHVRLTATTVSDLGSRVCVAHNDYALNEQDRADRFHGELT